MPFATAESLPQAIGSSVLKNSKMLLKVTLSDKLVHEASTRFRVRSRVLSLQVPGHPARVMNGCGDSSKSRQGD